MRIIGIAEASERFESFLISKCEVEAIREAVDAVKHECILQTT